MPCSNALWCTGLELKAIHHALAPSRSTTSAEWAMRGEGRGGRILTCTMCASGSVLTVRETAEGKQVRIQNQSLVHFKSVEK